MALASRSDEKMNPTHVRRDKLNTFADLPNVGAAFAKDFQLLGYKTPQDLIGCDGIAMYEKLCDLTATRHDPCVLDTMLSIAAFMNGGKAQPWWAFTAMRKQTYRGKYYKKS
jgi:Pathogenicity locus